MFHSNCISKAMYKAFFWHMMATFVFIGSLVKFKSLSRAPRMPNTETAKHWERWTPRAPNAEKAEGWEAKWRHLVFFKLQNSSFLFYFSHKLLDIWPMLSGQHFPCCPSFQFYTMRQLRDGQISLRSTIQRDRGTLQNFLTRHKKTGHFCVWGSLVVHK